MLEQDVAVELTTKLVEAGFEVDISARANLDPAHADEPSPVAWIVVVKPAIPDLGALTEIAAGFNLTAWIGHAGSGGVNFK